MNSSNQVYSQHIQVCKKFWIGLASTLFILLTEDSYVPWGTFNYTGTLRPLYPLSPIREVPAHIFRPDYVEDGEYTDCNIYVW